MAAKKKTAKKKAAAKKAPAKKAAKKKTASKKTAARKTAAKAPATKAAKKKTASKKTSKKTAATKDTAVAAAEAPAVEAAAEAAGAAGSATVRAAPSAAPAKPTPPARKVAPDDDEDDPKGAAAEDAEEEVEAAPELPPIPKMPARRSDGRISLTFAASGDQAFLVYALTAGKVDTEDRQYHVERVELHEAEAAAESGKPDVVTFSAGHYGAVQARYLLLPCGGTYGDSRGAVLAARSPIRAGEVRGLRVAVPALDHPAALALELWLPRHDLDLVPMPVPHISLMVRADRVRAGVLVNEDQVAYVQHNLVRVVDLGHWWGERTEGLPMPNTLMGVRRDIPDDLRAKIALDLKRSIAYALGHREDALDFAVAHAGKHERATVDSLVGRYVNDLTLDAGERGRQALSMLFREAHRHGKLASVPHLFFS
ncbi:MAG: MqnA/MqnD/SBP family protein [Planctomycetota bacterium]